MGLWELVKEHKRTMNELLCFSERRLTAAEMKSLYEVSWSDSHRKKTQEEDTVFLWEDFLVSCEKGKMDWNTNHWLGHVSLNLSIPNGT